MRTLKLTETDRENLACARYVTGKMMPVLYLVVEPDEVLSMAASGVMAARVSYRPEKGDLRPWLIRGAYWYIRREMRRTRRYNYRNAGTVVEAGVQMRRGGASRPVTSAEDDDDGAAPISLSRGAWDGALCGGSAGFSRGAEDALAGRGDPRARAALRAVFDELSPEDRDLLKRRFGDRMSMKELRELYGCADGTLRAWLERAELTLHDAFVRRGDVERPTWLSAPEGMLFADADDEPADSRAVPCPPAKRAPTKR